MSTTPTATPLPPELLLAIFEHLPPSTIIRLRTVCRAFLELTNTRSLWLHVLAKLPNPVPLPLLSPADLELPALTQLIHAAARLNSSWSSDRVLPRRTLKLKDLHADRITCLALLDGGRWLFTGSVDGWVRCWDLASTRRVKDSRPLWWGDVGAKFAEWDMSADVSALEVQFEPGGEAAIVVVGSYYSVESCRVFRLLLPLPTHDYAMQGEPVPQRRRASFFPLARLIHNWCGTQCVALEGDLVAVGGHLSPIQLLNWRTGAQAVLHNPSLERRSVAALKLLPPYLLSVTRCGHAELFLIPPSLGHATAADSDPADGALIDSHQLPISKAPLTSVSISRAWHEPPSRTAFNRDKIYVPISILAQHAHQSTIYTLTPSPPIAPSRFAYAFPPTPILTIPHPPTIRPESASLGRTGARAASVTSIRDFRPSNRVVAWTRDTARTVEDDIRDPDSVWLYDEIKDLYTEVACEEALGRVVVGTARGAVWVFDF